MVRLTSLVAAAALLACCGGDGAKAGVVTGSARRVTPTASSGLPVARDTEQARRTINQWVSDQTANTAVVVRASAAPSGPVQLTVDRPFIVVRCDLETKAVLFLGRVLDPTT
jgi:serine protease inhibitor